MNFVVIARETTTRESTHTDVIAYGASMQPGQVSAWVPIMVALLAGVFGIVGVIAGQLLNAKRERIREDLRWQREQERTREQNAHDARIEWRTQRFEIYKGFVASVDEFVRSLPVPSTPLVLRSSFERGDHGRRIIEGISAVEKAVVAIEFLGSKQLVDAADDLLRDCRLAQYSMWPLHLEDPNAEVKWEDWEDIARRHRSACESLKESRSEFMSKVKRELALVTSPDAEGKI
ncbi:hypothetical protein [Lentzea guizhouensis]|uniref:hypothetical protein n=1 Tax=Lentzea guizhouensis TaxID=1586287 RepID=UPI0012B68BCE|nr:hypothetical protein [Lentzea guizhouensis]